MKYYEFNEIVGKDYVYGEDNLLKRRNVRKEANKNRWSTSWGKILLDPNTRNIDKHEGKTFCRHFRVPALYFLDYLVPGLTFLKTKSINLEINSLVCQQLVLSLRYSLLTLPTTSKMR